MSTRLVLISHGMTAALRHASFPADEPLEDRALAEAADLAGSIGPANVAVHCPSVRCAQTATALGIESGADPALRDWNSGEWSGRGVAELTSEDLAAWRTDPSFAPPGGESLVDLLERTSAWLDALPENAGRVVAVTHPAFIRGVLVRALSATPETFWHVDIHPLAMATLSQNAGRWTLQSLA